MARTRTTKKLAQRIDLNYFKKPTPLKRAKFWLSLVLPLLAVIWISWRSVSDDPRVYSSGRMSKAHAVLEKDCGACHLRTAGAFSAKAGDAACLDCHDGPLHHAEQAYAPNCTTCHMEHRGRISLVATSNESCGQCHARPVTRSGNKALWDRFDSFEHGHPEFTPLRTVAGIAPSDPGTIKLNHAIHMKPIRRRPNGPNVQLECGNCHRPTSAAMDMTYSDAKYRAAAVSYKDSDEYLAGHAESLKPPRSETGREWMAPVKFANACAGCHLLTFDKRFDFGVPHDKPEVIREFLARTFREYISAHASELRVPREPSRDLTGKPVPPEVRTLTPPQWVMERTVEAEDLLWRKTCKQCHTLISPAKSRRGKTELLSAGASDADKLPGTSAGLPNVAQANTTLRWMPHAKFDHGAHEGFTCVSCHAQALTSTESSDILLPGMATCKTCHAPGPEHAESRCFECHTYHDWSRRKEVTPKFTLPGLATGGR
ncbi:MAG TPA: hypothetical protein VMR90_16665 [Candidatus Cybelea sp.]|nr:hypothetical protein [Candidatus Cybelea sp.]